MTNPTPEQIEKARQTVSCSCCKVDDYTGPHADFCYITRVATALAEAATQLSPYALCATCNHARLRHQAFSDHDECSECDGSDEHACVEFVPSAAQPQLPADVFVVLHEDRHTDAEPYVFLIESEAITKARQLCDEYARDKEDIEEELTDAMIKEGWVYHARYSCEGDCVTVMKRKPQ